MNDELFMRKCLTLAEMGRGFVNPNPMVGSVIVKDGRIISEGFHAQFGGPHAEAEAIVNASDSCEGAVLYCNLEPCCHTDKKTGPCAPRIIDAGVKRVVISTLDQNPSVNGAGVKMLREAGIEVVTGILQKDGEELNKHFFKSISTRIPFITVKIAQSKDGKISASEGNQTWLTGEKSREYVHNLRGCHDALLVGANTINIDDPQLNVRSGKGRNPAVVILDGNLSLKDSKKIFNETLQRRKIVFHGSQIENETLSNLRKRDVELIQFDNLHTNKIEITRLIKTLDELGISSLLVEGGANIFSQFICNSYADEIIVLEADKILNKGIDALSCQFPESYAISTTFHLGDDTARIYKKRLDF